MSKGSAGAAKSQVGVDNAYSSSFNKSGIQDRNTVMPFLQGEVTNPQGFGQGTVQDMLTQGGEAVSGATGAADEKSNLLASRTGNTAALSGAIGANARSAMGANSDNALSVAIQNAKLKQQQQQQGATGIGQMYNEDSGNVLKSLGLANNSIQDWTQGQAQANKDKWTSIQNIGQMAAGAASGAGL